MSLAALRRSSKTLAFWLLLVSLWGLPHRADGADTCPPAGTEQHDESKHVFSSEARADGGEHCAVCHWLRTIKHEFADLAAAEARPELASPLTPSLSHATGHGARRQLAARAPPAPVN
jgi:hypothetical protein